MWERALCRADPELFFPHEKDHAGRREAKEVCKSCPVLEECRERCIEIEKVHGIQEGVWAGLTSDERRRGGHARSVHSPRPFCARNHAMTGGNVLIVGGYRRCAICRRDSDARAQARRASVS